ncbi:MAG: dTDP-4-dehydrorhamnose 3,5-epimerase family protein [Actinomycetota bacterium]|nr:dTDP-4-dehydrorhamnose 3,5-epimerase family protein [Actinomycetota bacterium]MDI6821562.1 dTDP-4-dehydrorhamnose 3,5-epimerase family protein [Actinomycetota bacterium]
MIEGVGIKKLRVIPDERGFLMEMLRCDDPLFEKFGQVYITGCTRGVAKAWHYHKQQTDHFVCVSGKALVVLCDLRPDRATYMQVNEFILEAPPCEKNEPILLKIPPYVTHGFTAFDCEEARIVNVPTLPYRYDEPDEYRFPWNSEEIPYKWPSYVTRGG